MKNDIETLQLMLDDLIDEFKPDNNYLRWQKTFPSFIEKYGLDDFRNRKDSRFSAFGVNDLDPIDIALNQDKPKSSIDKLLSIGKENAKIRKLFYRIARLSHGISLEQKLSSLYTFAKYYGELCGAEPIEKLSDSLVGNPKNTLKVNGKSLTFTILRYYILYAQTCKFIDYKKINSVFELGGGGGFQIEVLKKLNPHLTIFLSDLPTQLYIAQQYLETVFPKTVIPYKETRDFNKIPEDIDGKIVIVGTQKINLLKYDLFWNSMSFQVMKPKTVENYLKYVNNQAQKYVCLHNKMALSPGNNPQITTIKDHYIKGLTNFELIEFNPSMGQYLGSHNNIINAIFKIK